MEQGAVVFGQACFSVRGGRGGVGFLYGYLPKSATKPAGSITSFVAGRGRHTRFDCDWSSDVCSSDLEPLATEGRRQPCLRPSAPSAGRRRRRVAVLATVPLVRFLLEPPPPFLVPRAGTVVVSAPRSEEHTSELQSQSNLVCRLLLEKK